MDFPKSGPQMPPPIPRNRDQWILASLFLIAGYLFYTLLTGTFFDLFRQTSYEGFDSFGSSRFYNDFSSLAMVPLALLADYFFERRDMLIVGAFAACFGLLLMLIPSGFLAIPAMVLFGTGTTLFSLSLLAYLGQRWSGGLLKKDAGYTFLVGAGLLGSLLASTLNYGLEGSRIKFILPIMVALLALGFGIAAILMRKESLFGPEKIPGRRKPERGLGGVLLGAFVVVSMVVLTVLNFLDPERELITFLFTFLAIVFFVGGGLILLLSKNYSIKERVSMIVLVGMTVLYWAVIPNGHSLMYDGWSALTSSVDDPYSENSYQLMRIYSNLFPLIGIGILGTVWFYFPKKGRGDLASGLRLLAGLLILMVIPLLTRGDYEYDEPASGGYLVGTIVFCTAMMMVMGLLFSMVYKFSPVKFRTLGFAVLLSGSYLVNQVRDTKEIILGIDPWYLGERFDTATLLLGILMLFAAGALLFIRMRKWD